MKFPKSMHAEGWANHFDDAAAAPAASSPKPRLNAGFKSGAKPVSANTPLHGDPLPRTYAASATTPVAPAAYAQPVHAAAAPAVRPAASTSAASRTAPRSNATPWVIGAGVGALLIGGAVVMSRNITHSAPAAPIVVGQATPSPEDVQLQTAPPSAGVVTPAETPVAKSEAAVVKPTPAETRTPSVAVAAAPAPKVQAPAPMRSEPAPVIRTLTPQPEVLAQASPPPVLRESPQAVTPLAVAPAPAATPTAPAAVPPDTTTVTPIVPPVAVAPALPPMAQQTPAGPDPVDTGITVQVRQALAADAALSTARIAVTTDHGVVKLEGQAPDVQARERATVVAAATTGVKAVDNRLTLPPMASLDKSISSGS